MESLTVVTAPSVEDRPVDIPAAKRFLRFHDDDDTFLLENLIDAAAEYYTENLGHSLLETEYDYRIDRFECKIELPRPPLRSVTSIQYVDSDSVTQTLATSVYEVVTDREPGFVRLAYNQSWPSTRGHPGDITIRFKAGYANHDAIPNLVRAGVLIKVRKLYEAGEGAPDRMSTTSEKALAWMTRRRF